MSVKIFALLKNSMCAKKGIRPGYKLVSINGNEINDVLDYRFYSDDKMKVLFESPDGERTEFTVNGMNTNDRLGLSFETYLMDKHRHCKNSCIFCFIDQLPKGLRKSLYFKDDDSRLSFLFGNYVTLTNFTDNDAERIIRMHISPVNVSVHTMNPELRVEMMKNPHAGEVLKYLNRFSDAGITINAQLVLCPGINDGDELIYSLKELSKLENVKSIAAVPVGLTKHREGLYPLKPFDENTAAAVIDAIDAFNLTLEQQGRDKLAYPSDEFFQLAKRSLPDYDYYRDFPQLDNGVGLLTSMEQEFRDALNDAVADDVSRDFAMATGMAAYDLFKKISAEFCAKFTSSRIEIYGVKNEFFGDSVTVAGLIVGNDLITHLKKVNFNKKYLLLPSVMFKSSKELIFLDDVSVEDVERELNTKVIVTSCEAYSLIDTFIGTVN